VVNVAVAFVAATSAAGATVTSTTVTITAPTGSAGDMLLIGVAASANAAANSSSPYVTSSSALLTRLIDESALLCETALFYRIVQAGDPSTYTFTLSAAAPVSVIAVRYSGVSSTNPFRFWNVNANLDLATDVTTTVAFLPLPGVQSTDMVVNITAVGLSSKSATPSTIPTPTGWTSRVTLAGPVSGTTAFPVTATFFDALGITGVNATPTITGLTGQWNSYCIVLVAASNPVADSAGGSISFVNAATAATSSTGQTSMSVNRPTNTANGNVLLLVAANSGGYSDFTVPAGWIPLDMGQGLYNQGLTTVFSDIVARLWYKIASSEPASYTVTTNGGQEFVLAVVAYAGNRNPNPIKVHGKTSTLGTASGGSTTSPAPYTLPQVTSDNLIVDIYVSGGDASGTFTVTGPTSPWTQRAQIISAVVSDFNASITVADRLSAGAFPTASASAVQTWAVFSVAILGAPPLPRVMVFSQAVQHAAFY
jgi:hypothetical protein